jgi:hypothetical protein
MFKITLFLIETSKIKTKKKQQKIIYRWGHLNVNCTKTKERLFRATQYFHVIENIQQLNKHSKFRCFN